MKKHSTRQTEAPRNWQKIGQRAGIFLSSMLLGVGCSPAPSKSLDTEVAVVAPAASRAMGPVGARFGMSLGASHACRQVTERRVECWGSNRFGQLGLGEPTGFGARRLNPRSISFDERIRAIAAGSFHQCALARAGNVYCWGHGAFGQLGESTHQDRRTPELLSGVSAASQVALGRSHTCVLTGSRNVRCFGDNTFGQLDVPEFRRKVVRLESNRDHTCAIDGSDVVCWGANTEGQLDGAGETATRGHARVAIEGAKPRELALGSTFTCVLHAGGTVGCWGANDVGQLGRDTGGAMARLGPVNGVTNAIKITAGAGHACALLRDKKVVCWGWNGENELGMTDEVYEQDAGVSFFAAPQPFAGGATFDDVVARAYATCASLSGAKPTCAGQAFGDFPDY